MPCAPLYIQPARRLRYGAGVIGSGYVNVKPSRLRSFALETILYPSASAPSNWFPRARCWRSLDGADEPEQFLSVVPRAP